MKAVRIALALALLAHCSPAADIAPVVSWSVETNALQPSQRGRKDLEIVRGETVVLECQLLSGGAAINLAEATSVLLRYTPANPATNSTHYVVTGSVHNAATGKVRVRWTPAAAPASDRLQYEIAVGSSTSTVARAWGLLRLLPGVGDDSTGSAVERSTIDWSTVDSQNEGDAPWPTDLADLDDVDTTGRAAGEVVSWNGTNYVHVAQGGHDAATVTGGMLTLSGQQIGLSTSTVRSAVSGIYLSLSGGTLTGTLNGISAQFSDTISAEIVTASNVTVSASGDVMKDGTPYWHPSNDGAGSEMDSDLLDGQHGAFYRNWSSITNCTGVLVEDADKGDISVSSGGTAWSLDNATVTAAKTTITGTPSGSKYLRDDWSWQTVSAGIGGSTGATDNLLLRSDGTGGTTLQNSGIRVDDATAATQQNVTIANADGATNSTLVLSPKGTGGIILGAKPSASRNGTGDYAVDLQLDRSAATQVASGTRSFAAGSHNTVNNGISAAVGFNNSVTGSNNASYGAYTFGCQNSGGGIGTVIAGCGSTMANVYYAGVFGNFSTVNYSNSYSLGSRVTINHAGCVVVGANDDQAVSSDRTKQFKVRADGGLTHQTDGGTRTDYGKRASAPGSPVAGDRYYDTTTNKERVYNGTTWNDCY